MKSNSKRAIVGALGLAVAFAAPAQAQWHATAIGVAEMDGAYPMFLAGIGAGPGGPGISPMVGVQGYHLQYNSGGTIGRTNVFAIKPYVGLVNNYGAGDLYGTVGYSYSNKDTPIAIATTASNDIGRGVVLAGGWDHWGTGTPWGHQVLAAYNFDNEGFWGRGRETRRIWQNGAAQRRLGGEVAYLTGDGYSAVQPGAILEIHNGTGVIIGLGAGMRFQKSQDANVYFKLEGVLPVIR